MRVVVNSCLLAVVVAFATLPNPARSAEDESMTAERTLFETYFVPDGALRNAAPPKVHWETNVLESYRKAIEQKKPFVLVYLCAEGRKGCTHCTKYRPLLSSALVEFHNTAVFAVTKCQLYTDPQYNKFDDKVAGLLFEKLELKTTPSITILAPNNTIIEETARLTGAVERERLVKTLRDALSPSAKSK